MTAPTALTPRRFIPTSIALAWAWPSRAIAQAHGGSVTASSGQGRTCFTLVFPHRVAKPRS
ncbi:MULTISPECIES: hypothetical protein [Comamonadaceae]|uniref:Histidine kinase/HSP90-like ATPase domain-containing protein n=1 Tax=Diaphorobacter limosus TaxID=3036128 RepID=A0ABZ0J330_9BURK|nr:hypothetical protein [Diaphorobacter sp. Y-1]WOO32655.1 hypothetical protein P4826_00555 [Diaphorobacter sp. Y-1]HRM93205.1 hypothetical protein [Alicycliphilus sp.]